MVSLPFYIHLDHDNGFTFFVIVRGLIHYPPFSPPVLWITCVPLVQEYKIPGHFDPSLTILSSISIILHRILAFKLWFSWNDPVLKWIQKLSHRQLSLMWMLYWAWWSRVIKSVLFLPPFYLLVHFSPSSGHAFHSKNTYNLILQHFIASILARLTPDPKIILARLTPPFDNNTQSVTLVYILAYDDQSLYIEGYQSPIKCSILKGMIISLINSKFQRIHQCSSVIVQCFQVYHIKLHTMGKNHKKHKHRQSKKLSRKSHKKKRDLMTSILEEDDPLASLSPKQKKMFLEKLGVVPEDEKEDFEGEDLLPVDLEQLEETHKQERDELDKTYEEVKELAFKKGVVYRDQNGRKSICGDTVSIESSGGDNDDDSVDDDSVLDKSKKVVDEPISPTIQKEVNKMLKSNMITLNEFEKYSNEAIEHYINTLSERKELSDEFPCITDPTRDDLLFLIREHILDPDIVAKKMTDMEFSHVEDFEDFALEDILAYLQLKQDNDDLPDDFPDFLSAPKEKVLDYINRYFFDDDEPEPDADTIKDMIDKGDFVSVQELEEYSISEIIGYIDQMKKIGRISKVFPRLENKTRKEVDEILFKRLVKKNLEKRDKENCKVKNTSSNVSPAKITPSKEKSKIKNKSSESVENELKSHIASTKKYSEAASSKLSYDSDSDGTVCQSNGIPKSRMKKSDNSKKIGKCNSILFCKAKITIPASETPTPKVRKMLQTFLTVLLKIDRKMVIYEYLVKSNHCYIDHPKKIPDVPSKIQKFFNGRWRPSSKGTVIWPQIKLGLSVDHETFLTDAQCLLEDKDMKIFKKDLQTEHTEITGYLLFSHRLQNKERLKKTIEDNLLSQVGVKDPIAMRWQKIMKTPGSGEDDEKVVQAYHIEATRGDGDRISKGIAHIYSSTRKKYPFFEKMRYIAYSKVVQHSADKEKMLAIANRQRWFSKLTEVAKSFEIAELDYVAAGVDKSLRQYIMEMKNSSGQQLFCTVDWHYDNSVVNFIYPEQYSSEAHDRIADLGSFIKFTAGETALVKYFTPSAAERALQSPWNESLGRAESQSSKEVDLILDECDNIDWLQQPSKEKVVEFETDNKDGKNEKKSFFMFSPNDDSSLPTLGLSGSINSKRSAEQSKDRSKKQKLDSGNAKEDAEMEESLSEDDDNTIHTLSSKLNDMSNKFDTIMTFLNQKHQNVIAPTPDQGKVP